MKYMGSKSRVAKYIVPIIQKYIDTTGADTYIEPFVGGANVIDKIQCRHRIGYDVNGFLIGLFSELQNGMELPDEVPKELYDEARYRSRHPDVDVYWYDYGYPCSLGEIGAIGFLASYNGRFFDGGYAKPGYEKTKHGDRYRDYYQEAKANLLAQMEHLTDVDFQWSDYRNIPLQLIGNNAVIYVDPPYKNVKQYGVSKGFDHDEFWDVMRKWSKEYTVLISELEAPDDFECIWSQEVSRSIDANHKTKAVEKLWKYKGEVRGQD